MLESAHYATGCEGREHPHPSQPLLAILLGAQTCSPDRHLLPVHHTVAVLFSPAVSAPCGMLLVTLACQVPYFFLHHQVHQGKTGRAQQVADSFLQETHDLGHGKDHLDVGILFVGQLAELLHRSLLVDLVSSFHSDSLLFSWQKKPPSVPYDRGCASRYFLRINGHPRERGEFHSFVYAGPMLNAAL